MPTLARTNHRNDESTGLSVVVPVLNEAGNITELIERIEGALIDSGQPHEIIVIDDNSSDDTVKEAKHLARKFPVLVYSKAGKPGKASSLMEGFARARYDLVAMIDGDLQYPPEALPAMVSQIRSGRADVMVANRNRRSLSLRRRIMSSVFEFSGKFLHDLDCDVQSGLKVFRHDILNAFELNTSAWTFDLEFLTKARSVGATIGTVGIEFSPRTAGNSKIRTFKSSYEIGRAAVALRLRPNDFIPFNEQSKNRGLGFYFRGQEYIPHNGLSRKDTALDRLTPIQISVIVGAILLVAVGFIFRWHTAITVFVAVLTALYFTDLLFNFFLIYRSFSRVPEIKISQDEIDAIHESEWPTYTVLCPLYKESNVLPQFVEAISAMDYNRNKLQVMLLLEQDDAETIRVAREMNLPKFIDIVVVPDSLPKTKPKACNYGLRQSHNEYVVIYDAEDVPEPQQLKRAYLAFKKAGPRVACIQSKLNFYNPTQNILTRAFTAEYSLWYELVLTGLQSINAPIPLGGTSNHFRRDRLIELGGWDAFNVTEDADLGIRLAKRGYKTAVVDSTTLEEANSDLKNWFWQRTRWIKGYIQTYMVHTRKLREFKGTSWKEPHAITFQLVIGGKVLSMFINPFMWLLTIVYFALRGLLGPTIESFFPTPVLYMAVASLIFGNFLYLYYYMIGCAKREHYDLIKYVYLVPLYWLAMSVAAWVALYEVFKKPHHWRKTIHGLHLPVATPVLAATPEAAE